MATITLQMRLMCPPTVRETQQNSLTVDVNIHVANFDIALYGVIFKLSSDIFMH